MKTKVRISRNSPAEFSLHKAIIAMLLAAGWLMAAGTARATDFYWINPGGGDWADTNNWSPSRIAPPSTGDNVFITAPGTYNVTDGGYADSLTLGDGTSSFPTLLLDSAGVFVWGGAYAAPGSRIILRGGDGSYLFGGGSFEADGGLMLEGEMDWQAGSLNGIVTVTTNGLISGSTSLNHYFTATVHNHGQILWSADNLTCGSGAEIQNMSDGLVDWQNDGAIGGWPGGVICAVINSGTMLKSAGTGILNFNSATLSNSGIVQVESGTLNLYQGLADSGNFAVSDGCALWLNGGNYYFNPGHVFTGEGSYGVPSGGSITLYGTITDPNFQMNGQLYGTNILAGTMNAYDGDFEGATTIASNGVLNASGCTQCGSVDLSTRVGGVLINAGTLNWLSGDWIGEGGSVVNLPNALINIQCDNIYGNWGGLDNWMNEGVIRKSAGAGTNMLYGMALNNFNLVDVQSGGLSFPVGFSSSGTFNVADGAAVLLQGGTYYFYPGHAFTGAGFYGVPSGNATIFGNIVATNFQMNGQLYGMNILAGTMNAYAGYFGGATTIASNGVLNVSGCTQCGVGSSTRISGVLTNAGTLNWLSGDWVSEGGTMVNLPGALFTIQCDNIYGNWGGLDNWINQGVIRKSAGTGTNVLYGVALNNSSLVDVQSGGLSFPLGFNSSGTFNVADGAAIPLQGGTYYLNPGHAFTGAGFYGVSSGGYVTLYGTITDTNFQMNGQLYGANILTGTMNAYDGYFYGVTTIASNGVLNVSGCTQCGSSYSTRIGGVLTNAGTINWLSGDWVSYSGTVVNLADALITIQCDNGYWNWNGLDSWFNAGAIRKFASAGTNVLDGIVLNNAGLVDVQTGGLSLTSLNNAGTFNVASGAAVLLQGGTMSGTFNVASGASVLLQGGTFNLNPGYAFNGAGFYGVPAGGSMTINGTIADANFQMNGQLYGANILTGTMNAYDGYFGGVTTIASNGVLNVSGCTQCGSSYSTRIAGVLTNAGTLNWLSGDWNSYSGTVVNLADTLMTIQCDNGYGNWSGLDSWFNAGTIRKFDSAGTNVLDGMVLNNAGLVDVQSGALQLQNTYSQTGGELNFGLTGPGEYGHIILAGNAPFTGTLGANLLGGYHPAVGNAFNVLTYASFSGSFTNLNLPDLPGNRGWIENYGDTTTTLIVTKGRIPLAIAQNSGNVTISWTTNADPGFVLQSTTNLAPPVVWQAVPNDVQVIGDQNSVTIPLTDDSVFFRLQE